MALVLGLAACGQASNNGTGTTDVEAPAAGREGSTARVEVPKVEREGVWQPWVKISATAPPTLIIHAMDDPVDDIRQAMAYALALNDAGVPVDMRLYAKGGHAFGMRPTNDPVTTDWPEQVRTWLLGLGVL